MSNLDRFELFTLVAELGTITQVASELNMTKAAVSKQIRLLESALRTNLFVRYKQRLHLTVEGEMLLNQSRRLCKELDNTRSLCEGFHQEPRGTLHVVVFYYFAQRLIFPRLKSFLAAYPKLKLIIDPTERVPNFEKEQVDIAVGFSLPVPDQSEVIQHSIMTTRYILCASPAYFKAHGKPQSLQDLTHHQYISHTKRTGAFYLKLTSQQTLQLMPYLRVSTVSAMIACALEGLGLIQLPQYVLETYLDSGQLIEVLPEYQATDAHVFYHYPKYVHPQPKIQKFIAHFLQN